MAVTLLIVTQIFDMSPSLLIHHHTKFGFPLVLNAQSIAKDHLRAVFLWIPLVLPNLEQNSSIRQIVIFEDSNAVTLNLKITTQAFRRTLHYQIVMKGSADKCDVQKMSLDSNPVTLTYWIATQTPHWSVCLLMVHHHAKFGVSTFNSSQDMEQSYLRILTL